MGVRVHDPKSFVGNSVEAILSHDAKDRQHVNGFRRAEVVERLLHACVTRDTREGVGVGLGATYMCWSPASVCTKQPMTPASSMSITSARSLMPQS